MLIKIILYIKYHKWKLIRFTIVGASTFVINFSFLWLFFEIFKFDYRIAITFAYLLTVVVHFILHRSFTYRQVGEDIGPHSLKYFAMLIVNYLITLSISTATVELFNLSAYMGIIFSTFFTPIFNFLFMNHFIFVRKKVV